MSPGLLVDARTGVPDRHDDVRSGGRAQMRASVGLIEGHTGRLDRQAPGVRHRLPRVDRQVRQHLLELCGIDFYSVAPAVADDHHVDVVADERAQPRRTAADERAEIDHLRLENLALAEREELTGQLRGALAGAKNLLDVGPSLIVARQRLQHQLREAVDRRQEVVEIVRDAAGEPADRLQLLCFSALILDRVDLGHVRGARHRPSGEIPPRRDVPPRRAPRRTLPAAASRALRAPPTASKSRAGLHRRRDDMGAGTADWSARPRRHLVRGGGRGRSDARDPLRPGARNGRRVRLREAGRDRRQRR